MIQNKQSLKPYALLPWILSGIVFLCIATTTVIVSQKAKQQELITLHSLLATEASRITGIISHRLTTYETVMRGVQGFFHGSERVDYGEFVQYVATLRASESLIGVQGIAYVAAIDRSDLDEHIKVIAQQLPVPYRVHPEGTATQTAPIQFIDPIKGDNKSAVGFDIYSNPIAKNAAILARDSGKTIITPPLTLIQDTNYPERRSFVMYLPVYRKNTSPQSIDERRAALMGWIDVPIRMNDFMAHISGTFNPDVTFYIRDTGLPDETNLVFQSDMASQEHGQWQDGFQVETGLVIGTRSWKLVFNNTPAFHTQTALPSSSTLIIFAGSGVTFAMALLVLLISKSWDKSERHAARMTHLYHALSTINQAIVRMDKEDELFPLVCKMAVDFGGMNTAWVGIVNKNRDALTVAASYGENSSFIPKDRFIPVDEESPQGQDPRALVIHSGEPFIANDLMKDRYNTFGPNRRPKQIGWQSCGVFPIHRRNKVFAVLYVYHQQKSAFDKEAVDLLAEMTKDIGFALDNFDRESQRTRFEQELSASENRLSTILENVGACIYLKDQEGRYLYANQQMVAMLGLKDSTEIVGHTDEKFFDEDTLKLIRQADYRVLQLGEVLQREEVDNWQVSGRKRTFWTTKMPLRKSNGSIYAMCAISTDISEAKAHQEEIHLLSNFDSLTGLPNRDLLRERSRQVIAAAKANNSNIALLCIDLDRFKLVNESLSHSVGDLVIKMIADRLTGELHLDATLCRIGGDEFFLLLPDTNQKQASETAHRLLRAIAVPLVVANQTLSLSASIGIAILPEHGRDFDQLSQSADAALAEAKVHGRNNIRFSSKHLRTRVTESLQLESDLRDAIQLDQLILHYQPQLDIPSGEIIGVEALVRWQHPIRGLIPPGVFIPLAEESDLIINIGSWVLDQALSQLNKWLQQGLPALSMAVNLSAVQLYHDSFFDLVGTLIDKHNIDSKLLELEITERIAMENASHTAVTLGRLQRMGVALSIDDFGTGFSSLNYLKRYPIQKLKIDKSFVDGLVQDSVDQAIVVAIIGLAKGLQFKTIAEGVETREQLNFLRDHGCEAYQGYYFSKPVPADLITKLLKSYTVT